VNYTIDGYGKNTGSGLHSSRIAKDRQNRNSLNRKTLTETRRTGDTRNENRWRSGAFLKLRPLGYTGHLPLSFSCMLRDVPWFIISLRGAQKTFKWFNWFTEKLRRLRKITMKDTKITKKISLLLFINPSCPSCASWFKNSGKN
jgi:hypothetical protein